MGAIYDTYNKTYNGIPFTQIPESFQAKETYNHLGEIRKRVGEAIQSLENKLPASFMLVEQRDSSPYEAIVFGGLEFKIWEGTREEFEAIEEPDPNTMYFIRGV